MSNKVFLDCLGRQIKVGDMLANGHRERDRGGITLGIVTGFTDDAMLITSLQRGHWFGVTDRWWSPDSTGDTWRLLKTRWQFGERCFIAEIDFEVAKRMINLESEALQ